jgi:predicted membrane-bound mannosyltransferase
MEEIKKKSRSKLLWVIIVLVVIILVVVGYFMIFGKSGSTKFVDKFNELQSPATEIKNNFSSAGGVFEGIADKETNKDYAGIISDLQTAITSFNNAETEVTSTDSALNELQSMVNASKDQDIKTTGARFIEVFKSRNAAMLKMITDGKNFANLAITYYTELKNNQKLTVETASITDAASALTTDSDNIVSIATQYDTAANDFAKAAGFTIEK